MCGGDRLSWSLPHEPGQSEIQLHVPPSCGSAPRGALPASGCWWGVSCCAEARGGLAEEEAALSLLPWSLSVSRMRPMRGQSSRRCCACRPPRERTRDVRLPGVGKAGSLSAPGIQPSLSIPKCWSETLGVWTRQCCPCGRHETHRSFRSSRPEHVWESSKPVTPRESQEPGWPLSQDQILLGGTDWQVYRAASRELAPQPRPGAGSGQRSWGAGSTGAGARPAGREAPGGGAVPPN